jgi:hypothetical protein
MGKQLEELDFVGQLRCQDRLGEDLGIPAERLDPIWDNLREEPEFWELLKKVGVDVWPR